MARVIKDSGGGDAGLTLSNPSVFGVDLGTGAEIVGGIVGTAWVNDKIVGPLVDPLVAGFRTSNNTVGQILSGITTLGSAWLLSQGVKMVASAKTASMVLLGGGSYGVAKMVAGVVPGLSVDARYPDILGGLNIFGPKPIAPVVGPRSLTAGAAGIPNGSAGLTTIRSQGMGY